MFRFIRFEVPGYYPDNAIRFYGGRVRFFNMFQYRKRIRIIA